MLRSKKNGTWFPAYKIVSAVVLLGTLFFSACTANSGAENTENTAVNTAVNTTVDPRATAVPKVNSTIEYDDEDTNTTIGSDATKVTLKGNSITVAGTGASVNGSTLTIIAGGTYQISGTLNDGQIVVNTTSKTTVRLVLNGVNITCSDSAPIYVHDGKKVVIVLADGTKNSITDGATYTLTDVEAQEPNATLFCKCDLTITGKGSLTINANYNNGITVKDALKITSGIIVVTAISDGIKGKDYVAIKDASITVYAKADGIQSGNEEDAALGFVSIESGTLNINAGLDGIQAETDVWMGGGTLTINSVDDALDSNGSMTISGGTLKLTAGDDGMNANSSLSITGGNITITGAPLPTPIP